MTLAEFKLQDKYCRENNIPEGVGCDGCPAKDKKHCADRLRGLCGLWRELSYERSVNKNLTRNDKFEKISEELDIEYGISPFSQLELIKGIIEFPR